eukprot:304095_1
MATSDALDLLAKTSYEAQARNVQKNAFDLGGLSTTQASTRERPTAQISSALSRGGRGGVSSLFEASKILSSRLQATPKSVRGGRGVGKYSTQCVSLKRKANGEPESPNVIRKFKYSRKDKSLGVLCTNFILMYMDLQGEQFCLDDVAARLGVERRRIYDIVNVLESVDIVSRKGKNNYIWHGFSPVEGALARLRSEADHIPMFRRAMGLPIDESTISHSQPELSGSQSEVSSPSAGGGRREKSLSKLSQRFIQLLLLSKSIVITLDDAANQLIHEGEPPKEDDPPFSRSSQSFKSKVRRLYDIAKCLNGFAAHQKSLSGSSKTGIPVA